MNECCFYSMDYLDSINKTQPMISQYHSHYINIPFTFDLGLDLDLCFVCTTIPWVDEEYVGNVANGYTGNFPFLDPFDVVVVIVAVLLLIVLLSSWVLPPILYFRLFKLFGLVVFLLSVDSNACGGEKDGDYEDADDDECALS